MTTRDVTDSPIFPEQQHTDHQVDDKQDVNLVVEVGIENIRGGVNVQDVRGSMDLQEEHNVRPEPLQQSVQETKTRERRLVFDTLKGVSKGVIDSYNSDESIQKVKSRLESEIIRISPKANKKDVHDFVEGLDLKGNPKNIDRDALRKSFEGTRLTEREVDKVIKRACFVDKTHISFNTRDFKAKLTQKILNERAARKGAPLTQAERKQVEKQVKNLDLGKKPRELTSKVLKTKLHDAGLLSKSAAKTMSKEMCEATKVNQVGLLKSDLKNIDSFKNKLFHAALKQGLKDGKDPLTPDQVKALKKQIDELDLGTNPRKVSAIKLARKLSEEGILDKKTSKNVAKSVCKEYQASLKNVETEARKLSLKTQELNRLLNTEPKDGDLKRVNEKVITLLREAFETKAYQTLKECEDNPTIHYLHEINLSMYTKVPLLDAYVSSEEGNPSLGDRLVERHGNKRLGQQIQEVRDDAIENRGLFSSHSCMKYILNHFEQFWGAFTSQKIGAPLGTYDPHGTLGNNAGALYEETLDINGKEGKALDVRTPSPTVDDKVSGEFKAGLQAIQNQRIAELIGEEGYGRPNCWVYTNYQDITDYWNGEHGRSKAIMKLNDEFPLSFKGITLSKDSDYFKEGIGHGEGDKLWEHLDPNMTFNKDAVDEFVDEMKAMLTDDSHFTLSNRTKDKGEKLYFPAKTEQEITDYKRELERIAVLTGDFMKKVVGDNNFQGKEAWLVKAAGKEFAWAAIQKLIVAKELQNLETQGITPSVITTSACKEDIDRGFSDHIKRMFMLGAGDEKFLAKIVNMPALMARYRVILNDRIQPLIGVVTHVDRDLAKDYLNKVTEGLEVSSTSARLLHQSVAG